MIVSSNLPNPPLSDSSPFQLGLMDPATGVLTGESFTLKYHDVVDVLDFLVLRQYYELAIQRNWQPGDRFRCIIDDLWWEGLLVSREPYNAQYPDSMFLCYRIRFVILYFVLSSMIGI